MSVELAVTALLFKTFFLDGKTKNSHGVYKYAETDQLFLFT